MNRSIFIFFSTLLFITSSVAARELTFNKFTPSDTNHYSFIVGGHFYGGNTNSTGLPTNTVLANLHVFNDTSNHFTICVGDMFKDRDKDVPLYKDYFFSKLKRPIFNALGNHDITGTIGTKENPQTALWKYGPDVHVVLNTELDDGSIIGNQLELLKEALNSGAENVFIYSHRPVWAEEDIEMEGIFKNNTRSRFGVNFNSEIKPLLEAVEPKTNIFWFSGSLGGDAPASFFYHEVGNIRYMQTAVRGLKRDGVIKVESKLGKVSFQPISFTGESLQSLESYNLDFWRTSHPEEEFNYRLIKLYLEEMVFHRYFWYGVLYTILAVVVIAWWRKRKRRTKRPTERKEANA